MSTVSFIIPTLNRSAELRRLLESFSVQTVKPDEIIIVDQGREADNLIIKQFNNLAIKHQLVGFQSLTKARNFGVAKASGEIICFLDDDIVLAPDYVEKVLAFFAQFPASLGVQGVIANFEEGHARKVGGNSLVYKIYNLLAKIFLLNNSSATNKLLWSGRNQYASRVVKVMNCEWLSGIGNYRRQIFQEFKFAENLQSYALGEDKLFSYPIFLKYPQSLFVDPAIRCEHHHPADGLGKSREWVEMKIKYTYYLWKQLFSKRGFLAYLSYFWANLGDLLVVFISVLLGQNKFRFWWWHVRGYFNLIWKK